MADDKIGMVEKVDVFKYNAVNDMPRWLRTCLGEVRELFDQIDRIEVNTKQIPKIDEKILFLGRLLISLEKQTEDLSFDQEKTNARLKDMERQHMELKEQLSEMQARLEARLSP